MVKLIESTTLTFSRNIKAKSNNNKPLNADSNFSFLLEVFYIFEDHCSAKSGGIFGILSL